MSAPRRWLDDGGSSTPFERDLLRSASTLDPPPGAQDAVWASLLGKLPPIPPGGAGGSGAGAIGKGAAGAKVLGGGAAAVGGGVLTSVLIGAGSAVALIATYAGVTMGPQSTFSPANPAPAQPAQIATVAQVAPPRAPAKPLPEIENVAPSPAPAAPAPNVEHRVEPVNRPVTSTPADAPAPPSPAAAAADAEKDRETMLREESRMVGEARDALRRGDYTGALSSLEQVRARFPGGVLVQEREALAIEALYRSGRRGDASARADAFLKAYPSSTLAARVESFKH